MFIGGFSSKLAKCLLKKKNKQGIDNIIYQGVKIPTEKK